MNDQSMINEMNFMQYRKYSRFILFDLTNFSNEMIFCEMEIEIFT